jgi:hypothetical protein
MNQLLLILWINLVSPIIYMNYLYEFLVPNKIEGFKAGMIIDSNDITNDTIEKMDLSPAPVSIGAPEQVITAESLINNPPTKSLNETFRGGGGGGGGGGRGGGGGGGGGMRGGGGGGGGGGMRGGGGGMRGGGGGGGGGGRRGGGGRWGGGGRRGGGGRWGGGGRPRPGRRGRGYWGGGWGGWGGWWPYWWAAPASYWGYDWLYPDYSTTDVIVNPPAEETPTPFWQTPAGVALIVALAIVLGVYIAKRN